jgi:DNA repair ATPase RecN
MDNPRADGRSPLRRRRVLILFASLVVAGIFAASGLVVYRLWKDRPNLYDPARVDLVRAQRQLYEAYGKSTKAAQLRDEIRAARLSLDEAAALLEKAEQVDPADRAKLTAIRDRLATLEDSEKTERMTPKELHDAYQQLSEELTRLAQKLE